MIRKLKSNIHTRQAALILTGIGFGVAFWVLESAVHILVFKDDSFVKQIYSPEPHEIWMRFTVVGMFISFGVYAQWIVNARKRTEEKLIASRKSLRDLASHLQVVRDEERGRIAREIHDEMGQVLTVLKMDLHWLGQRLPHAAEVLIAKTMAMSTLIETTIQSVKKICSELRPQLLDDFGLSAAIEWQAEEFGNRTGIQFEIISDPEDIILDHAHSTAIFRIFQETLTNIARHADATRGRVILKETAGVIEMEIHDNGNGIKDEQILHPKSFGLIGMRERAHFFGGDFKISAGRDKGTTVKVSIPIDNEGKRHDKNTDC